MQPNQNNSSEKHSKKYKEACIVITCQSESSENIYFMAMQT